MCIGVDEYFVMFVFEGAVSREAENVSGRVLDFDIVDFKPRFGHEFVIKLTTICEEWRIK